MRLARGGKGGGAKRDGGEAKGGGSFPFTLNSAHLLTAFTLNLRFGVPRGAPNKGPNSAELSALTPDTAGITPFFKYPGFHLDADSPRFPQW